MNTETKNLLLDLPADAKKTPPLLIILHGLTGFKEEAHLAAIAKAAAGIGFAALRPDLYGHGAGSGSFRDHTPQIWIEEIRGLVSEARKSGRWSAVFLCGHSQGALCAILAAAADPGQVDGVIQIAPALKIPEQARRGTLFGLRFDPAHVPAEVRIWDEALDGAYIRSAQALRAEDGAAYPGPVLFVHSDADERVPLTVSVEAVRQYPRAQLTVLGGDTNDFDRHPKLLAEAVTTWLLQQIS